MNRQISTEGLPQGEVEGEVQQHAFDFEGGWRLLPLAATLGGALAYGPALFGTAVVESGSGESLTQIAIAAALVVGGWLPLWQALVYTDWKEPLDRWRSWTRSEPLPSWPYVQPGTPGARLHHRLGQARAWWRGVGRKHLRQPIGLAALGAVVTLLLSLVLGRLAMLLSVVFVTCTELAVLWSEGQGEVGAAWLGVAAAGLPWLLGSTLNQGEIVGSGALSTFVVALLIGFYAARSWSAILGPSAGAVFLVWLDKPAAAGWLLLLALPSLMVLVHNPTRREYRKATGPWVLIMVALMALVL